MENKLTHDVFTPTTPARLTFVERESVNTKIVNALRTPGKQVVVYGHSGSGKTTLLVNKLHQLYEKHITSRCMKGLKFETLILDAFDQLSPFYISESSTRKTTTISGSISQDYINIKSQVTASKAQETGEKTQRILPPQLTPQALGRFMGEANCCWVLEDFHKIDEEERSKLSQIMKVFMDMADEYRQLKVVAIGAVDTARQVVEYDPEMRNRVAEIYVPLMEPEEILCIASKGEELLNIEFAQELKQGISHYSSGLASICHHLCLNICTSQEIYETSPTKLTIPEDALDAAVNIYLEEASDTLKKAFDQAFKQEKVKKFDNAKLILSALTKLRPDGALRSEIYSEILKGEPKYPQGNLTSFLKKLSTKEAGIIQFDSNSNKYYFADPLYRSFATALFSKQGPRLHAQKAKPDIEVLFKELESSFKSNLKQQIWFTISKHG